MRRPRDGRADVVPLTRWVRDPRSWGLVFCAGAAASRALAYRPGQDEPLPAGLAGVAETLSVGVYGALWAVTAAGLLVIAVKQRAVSPWDALLVAAPALWGIFYMIGGISDGNEKAITAAFLFWFLGGIFGAFLLIRPRLSGHRSD